MALSLFVFKTLHRAFSARSLSFRRREYGEIIKQIERGRFRFLFRVYIGKLLGENVEGTFSFSPDKTLLLRVRSSKIKREKVFRHLKTSNIL